MKELTIFGFVCVYMVLTIWRVTRAVFVIAGMAANLLIILGEYILFKDRTMLNTYLYSIDVALERESMTDYEYDSTPESYFMIVWVAGVISIIVYMSCNSIFQ